jgi:ABC-2 type transport system permease protein
MNTSLWLIKREFWENRAIWIIPAAIAALVIVASLFGNVEATVLGSTEQTRAMAGMMFVAFSAVFFVAMSIYVCWYLLDCLYADRRDRSILFWKSLPISDTVTVLSKVFVALVAIPLVYFGAADAASLMAALVLSVRAHALLGNSLWQPRVWLQLQVVWIYVIATSAIWYLPVSGWLLVVSAWARRAVMLWSVLPPLAVILAERLFIGTHACLSLIGDRLVGYAALAFHADESRMNWGAHWSPDQPWGPPTLWGVLDPWDFLTSPATVIGALIGAALIAGAIAMRKHRPDY